MSDKYFRSKQAAQNPVGLSMFFHVLITAIMRQLLGWNKDDKRGIFGNLNGYYGMVESQNRGTLHIHLLIWLEGYVRLFLSIFYGCHIYDIQKFMLIFLTPSSPSPDALRTLCLSNDGFQMKLLKYINGILCTDQTIAAFPCIPKDNNKELISSCEPCEILSHVSRTSLYDPILDPSDNDFFHKLCHRVYDAINTFQMHSHTLSCYKGGKGGCRYRKPDRVFESDIWEEKTSNFFLKKSNGMVNNFNLWLTLAINANTDVQFLTSGNTGLVPFHMHCKKSNILDYAPFRY